MGSVSDGVSMRGAGAGSRGWRAGSVGDARAALRRSKARRAVSRAPRRWVENEKTSVPGALDNNRGMCLHPSRGVSADRGRPAACDRASPADSSASQTGARRARVEPAPRDTLAPVGARLGPKNKITAMNSDAASRTIAHGYRARLGFRGHRGGEERRETGDLNRHRRTLMCFTFRAGRASRSGRRASREREPRWQFVTSRHRSENFGRSKHFSRLQPVEFCPDNNSCQLAQLAVKLFHERLSSRRL